MLERVLILLWAGLALGAAGVGAQHRAHAEPHVGPFAGSTTGTARVPTTAPMPGVMRRVGSWMLMGHGSVNVAARRDPGPRGTDDLFQTSMVMGHARRALGPGWLELQAMFSAEPALGASGYSLLLQSGETADGETPLVDRQHPHDLFMGLSASFRWEVEEGAWAFVYVARVGEPALGPVAFMHRPSGQHNPVAPITHHFLDATHIAYGVVTAGMSTELLQLELSAFNGREPDERRWQPDGLRLNSFAGRITVTPSPEWAIQGSFGSLDEPEQLHPAIDLYRVTLSATHHHVLSRGWWSSTVAFGRNTKRETTMTLGEARERLPGPLFDHYVGSSPLPPGATDDLLLLFERRVQSAWLVESSVAVGPVIAFGRYEAASKDELFEPSDPRHSSVFGVTKLEIGGVVDVELREGLVIGIGGTWAAHGIDSELEELYGAAPKSSMVFGRIVL
ncbi:MAG: hypothetical protein AAF389_02210 [Gemmatimonadota bacterium]